MVRANAYLSGTYRSRERRRKNKSADSQPIKKPKLTYAELQQRRKERKFGTGEGNKVGADEDTRVKLEKGVKSKSAPKVAQSNRGRELRAAAALKRFESQQKETELPEKEEDETGDEMDYEEDEEDKKTVDVGGGKFLVPVSGEEDGEAEQDEMKKELLELAGACGTCEDGNGIAMDEEDGKRRVGGDDRKQQSNTRETKAYNMVKTEDDEEELIGYNPHSRNSAETSGHQPKQPTTSKQIKREGHVSFPGIDSSRRPNARNSSGLSTASRSALELPCSVCSVINGRDAVLCTVCANVLEPDKMPNAWKCSSTACDGTTHMNAGDAGVCGVCGQRKSR